MASILGHWSQKNERTLRYKDEEKEEEKKASGILL